MILVDTSVWIEVFSKRIQLDEREFPLLATCLPIYQEVLQGIRSDLQKKMIQSSFDHLVMLSDPLDRKTFARAADLYRVCRKNGVTIRSTIDCLIAAIAEQHSVTVWTLDRDLIKLSQFAEFGIKE
jgi:predicted nucleic acid-binding protein